MAALIGASQAAAQSTSPVTVLRLNGASPHARVCNEMAARGDTNDAAIYRCTRALREEQGNQNNLIITHINRGNMYMGRRQAENALADFEAALALDENNAEARLNKGVAQVVLERFGPAIATLTDALSRGVNEPHKAYYSRAAAREALGDFRGALEDYTTALEIRPNWGIADAEMQRLARARQERLAQSLDAAQ